MRMIEGDLLRRGVNQNNAPVRQVFAYLDNYDEFVKMENPFVGED